MRRIRKEYVKILHQLEVEVFDEKRQPLSMLSQKFLCCVKGSSRIHCIVRDGRNGRDYHLPKQKIKALYDHKQRCSHIIVFVYPRRGRRRNRWIMTSVHDCRTFLLPETAFVDVDEYDEYDEYDERARHRGKRIR